MNYKKRWFVLKDTYLAYLVPEKKNTLGFPILVDARFRIQLKLFPCTSPHAIVITNQQRSLVLKCRSRHEQREWHEKLTKMCQSQAARMFTDARYLTNGSYAPIRADQRAAWHINGAKYMEHVYWALANAREEIYIAAWWLTPETYLIRPVSSCESSKIESRLDQVLFRKAEEGVKIYILLFKEVYLSF